VHLGCLGRGVREHPHRALGLPLEQLAGLLDLELLGKDLRRGVGTRSCRRRSDVLSTGQAMKRRCMGWSRRKEASERKLIAWWWTMYERTVAPVPRPARARACSRSPRRTRRLRCARPRPEALEVLARLQGRNHQRHDGGVRGDDQVLREAALQAEPGHAEGLVLVVEVRVVSGCSPTPRCPTARCAGARTRSGAPPPRGRTRQRSVFS
jgi:hypothetical protein